LEADDAAATGLAIRADNEVARSTFCRSPIVLISCRSWLAQMAAVRSRPQSTVPG
jgi:hypothetical protein